MVEFTKTAAHRVARATVEVEGRRVNDRGRTRRYPLSISGDIPIADREFCLVTDLAEGGSCTCRDVDTGEEFEASDIHGEYSGIAGESGGTARWVALKSEWRIIRMTCPGFVSAACSSGSGSG